MNTMTILLLALNTILLAVVLWQQARRREEGWASHFESLGKSQERMERIVREDISKNREEMGKSLSLFSEASERKLEKVREVVERQLQSLQEDNSHQLEKMRETVDEKLHSTLEKRLGESFQTVSERLEKVHQGLGEMQTLAAGVGDLKKVLTNVKTRGTWGEIQLGNLLEQILTTDQYEKNIPTKAGSRDPVEFAIKLPGKQDQVVYIPIDAKFPKEDYERLLQAQEAGDAAAVEESSKALENRMKLEAKRIREKYIDPPNTTDFAILYLPIEGLYAEVIRRPGLFDHLQREFRVTISGPTNITAHLNALQMGFRTLAVGKRADEVWSLLGEVNKEFGTFGDLLSKTHKKIVEAGLTIEQAATKSRTIERKLKKVQELPAAAPTALIEKSGVDISYNPVDDDAVVQ